MVSETGYKTWISTISYKDKFVKVTVEFPEQSDIKARQELTGRLKAMYLEKIENSIALPQAEDSAASTNLEGQKQRGNEMNHE